MSHSRRPGLFLRSLPLFALPFLLFTSALATSPEIGRLDSLWGSPAGALNSAQIRLLQPNGMPGRDLREILGQFQQTCTFLDSMQEHNPEDGSFGGLHEGEGDQLWGIIETDNTQEAIRVWCEYARYFEDPDSFPQNVEDAWTYCDSFPAWQESEPEGFYAMHNAGWGLIANIGYRRVYGDGRDDYGRQCAEHLIENVPQITPNMQDALMPLVAGWSAGTLYLYGIEEGIENNEYVDEARTIAREVRAWIEADPDRLNRNEIWALCGGTALWGVIIALGDDEETAAWIQDEALPRMDVIAGRGNWNVSWNIWYAHAWWAAFEKYQNEEYRTNVETIIDTLLALDTDDDGGIPATIGDANNRDQAWVSAYTAWMGLSNLFEFVPEVDLTILRLTSPLTNRPWPVGEPLPVRLSVQQNGSLPEIDALISVTGAWEYESEIHIEGWQPIEVTLPDAWTPGQPGQTSLIFIIEPLEGLEDADASNDTLRQNIGIRPAGNVDLSFVDTLGNGVSGSLTFSSLEFPGAIPPLTIELSAEIPGATERMMRGHYSVRMTPDFPFPEFTLDSFFVSGVQNQDRLSQLFIQPPLLLIDADTDSTNITFYSSDLENLALSHRIWRQPDGDIPFTQGFQVLLVFSGDAQSDILSASTKASIESALNSGISVLVSGQNIAQDLVGDPFLADVLKARLLSDNTRARQVTGLDNDAALAGTRLLLIGNLGANNQNSPDGIEPVGRGIACAVYQDRGDTAAIVRWEEDSGARGMFCALGIEGASGQGGTTSRAAFMERAFEWLGVPLAVEDDNDLLLPVTHQLLTAYPNPFNGIVTFVLPEGFGEKGVIQVWDMGGRLVSELSTGGRERLVWGAGNAKGSPLSSGIYFVKYAANGVDFEAGNSVRIVYLK